MLHELVVRNLGVIEEASALLGPGVTALTGETGAGKTLVTEAINLLTGGRADAAPGPAELEEELDVSGATLDRRRAEPTDA